MLLLLLSCRLTGPQAEMAAVPAMVRVEVWPADATVLIGEQGGAEATVGAGEVEVVVQRSGFADHRESVVVRQGEGRQLAVRLQGLPQAVSLNTTPAGATVLDGNGLALGVTPWVGERLSGPLGLHLNKDGWASQAVDDFIDGSFSRDVWLDPEGQLLDRQRIIPTCSHPKAVLLHPTRDEVWVACLDGPPSVVAHVLSTGEERARIALGETGAVELHWSEDASRLYASQMETAFVYEIDADAYVQTRVMDTDSIWSKVIELSVDGQFIYVSNWLGDEIAEIDLRTGKLSRNFPTVAIPRGLYATTDGLQLYVAGFDKGQLAVIDLASGRSRVLWNGGVALRHIVADEDKGLLYLSDMARDAIFVYDMASGEMRELARTARHPNTIALSDDREVLFVSCRGRSGSGGYLTVGDRGAVLAIDVRTGVVLDAIAAGNQPTALDVRGELLVFSDFRDDRLQVYRIPPTEVLRAGPGRWEAVPAELKLPDPVP